MIDSIKGASAVRELLGTISANAAKLSLPVSIEVLEKLLQTKDGYKYLATVEGKTVEAFSQKELAEGLKYWAEGVKKEGTLLLENIVQKPTLLQSELTKNDTLKKALGFDKLVDALNDKPRQNTDSPQNTKPENQKQEILQTKIAVEERLAAAKGETTTNTQPQPKEQKVEMQTPPKAQGETAAKEPKEQTRLKAADTELAKTKTPETDKNIPKEAPKESTAAAKNEAAKIITITQTIKGEAKDKIEAELKKETPKTQTQESQKKELQNDIAEKLKSFKNVVEGGLATNRQPVGIRQIQDDVKIPQEMKEELKRELLEKISLELQKDFSSVPQNIVEDIAKKITDIMFKTFFEQRGANAEEATLKILEHIQTLMEHKEKMEAAKQKKAALAGTEAKSKQKTERGQKEDGIDGANDNPPSKVKASLLDELSKTADKHDFNLISSVAVAVNKEAFTFVLDENNVVQFRKKGEEGLNAKTVEFYGAFETLGPVGGTLTYTGDQTLLSLDVEFESTYKFLKEALSELTFFDGKNISIKTGIKEIFEIKTSLLDTTG